MSKGGNPERHQKGRDVFRMFGGKDIKMARYTIMIVALFLCIPTVTTLQAKSQTYSGINKKGGVPIITVTKLDINDNTLNLSYEIRNESKQHIWILEGFGRTDVSAEVFMDKDDRTLLIRSRFDGLFPGGVNVPSGRYVLMRAGETQKESVSLAIPVHFENGFTRRRNAQGLEYATILSNKNIATMSMIKA